MARETFTCLRDCNDLVVVAVASSFEVLRKLSCLATACLADNDCHCIAFDSVQQSIFVACYWQQRTGLVQGRDESVCVGHDESNDQGEGLRLGGVVVTWR